MTPPHHHSEQCPLAVITCQLLPLLLVTFLATSSSLSLSPAASISLSHSQGFGQSATGSSNGFGGGGGGRGRGFGRPSSSVSVGRGKSGELLEKWFFINQSHFYLLFIHLIVPFHLPQGLVLSPPHRLRTVLMHGMKTALPHHRLVGGLGVGQRALEEEEGEEEEVVGALEAPKGLVSRATMGKEGEVALVVVEGGEEEGEGEEDLDGEDLVSHCQCVARLTSC